MMPVVRLPVLQVFLPGPNNRLHFQEVRLTYLYESARLLCSADAAHQSG